MTAIKPLDLTCPSCGGAVQMDYHQSANIAENPELKPMILDLRLNVSQCGSCGQKVFIDEFFIYNDPSKRLFLVKHPLYDLDQWENLVAGNEAMMEKLPRHLRAVGVRPQMVFGPFALKERILLADDGYSPGAVEVYKIGLMGQLGEEYFNRRYRLFYLDTEDEHMLFVLVDIEQSQEKNLVKVPIEVYENFEQITFPSISGKKLVRHVTENPFVSMEKVFFAKEMIDEYLK